MTAAARLEAVWRDGGPAQWALRPLGALHGALVGLRRLLYRRGWKTTVRLPCPVIVVGNRVAGGAGKTPTTLALVHALQQAGWHPGIVSRGHGGQGTVPRPVGADSVASAVGDEPLLMQRRTGVPVWVGRDRAAAAHALLNAHPDVNVLVCDDGLQHLRLGRDLEIVVFDERGAGNGWLLPAGPLREPIDAPAAAPHQCVLYNAAKASTALPGACATRQLAGAVDLAGWWSGAPATHAQLAALRGRRLLASAGIGQPQRFFDALRTAGLTIDTLALDDHHDHARLPWPPETREVVVTEKDAIKLDPQRVAAERPGLRVWIVPLVLVLPAVFIRRVLDALGPAPAR
ncbi:tetraacyldisaccharide 4'-kinase [Sphaerotilus montanus]|uniref:Tetraacyldisaccharide 4'-kinase n=1 Tax=Sphaerotilus montanus TaxID=522889 RepID=A0A7Y9UAA7_9BURK|nr:tetraacyldisaccharide 4'-kinase [Sphaerotilus montanus]NYG31244.1 tetraacyldisaccharide 4'-kinase [Sphaerotilus montanus]NZD55230.1 tetraacyldisaccharide 4'-kinase [Sphaerotilus montanus]